MDELLVIDFNKVRKVKLISNHLCRKIMRDYHYAYFKGGHTGMPQSVISNRFKRKIPYYAAAHEYLVDCGYLQHYDNPQLGGPGFCLTRKGFGYFAEIQAKAREKRVGMIWDFAKILLAAIIGGVFTHYFEPLMKLLSGQ